MPIWPEVLLPVEEKYLGLVLSPPRSDTRVGHMLRGYTCVWNKRGKSLVGHCFVAFPNFRSAQRIWFKKEREEEEEEDEEDRDWGKVRRRRNRRNKERRRERSRMGRRKRRRSIRSVGSVTTPGGLCSMM